MRTATGVPSGRSQARVGWALMRRVRAPGQHAVMRARACADMPAAIPPTVMTEGTMTGSGTWLICPLAQRIDRTPRTEKASLTSA